MDQQRTGSNNKLSDKEIKNEELKLLRFFHQICVQNSFQYSLAGGSLLGAIRHEGFIPWDDDIDILMKREDYNAFIDYCSKHPIPFSVLDYKNNSEYGLGNAKICSKDTYLIEDTGIRGNYIEGVYLDLFPIDPFEDSLDESIRLFNSIRPRLELLNAANWEKFALSKSRSIIMEPIRFVLFLLTRFVKPNAIVRGIELTINRHRSAAKYSGCFYGTYRQKEILLSHIYADVELRSFEGEQFYCLKHYDEYLKCLYGDYMKLPPIEKQISHHGFEAYWK